MQSGMYVRVNMTQVINMSSDIFGNAVITCFLQSITLLVDVIKSQGSFTMNDLGLIRRGQGADSRAT